MSDDHDGHVSTTGDPVDDNYEARQRFHVSVPNPGAALNLGSRYKDAANEFSGSFGYEGLSMTSSAHMFIDCNKRFLFQTGQATFQAGDNMYSYASAAMVNASVDRLTLASGDKVVMAAGAGQGAEIALDYGTRPPVRRYNGILLEDLVQRQVTNLTAFFDGTTKWLETKTLAAQQLDDIRVGTVSDDGPKFGEKGFWKLSAETHKDLGHYDDGLEEEIARIRKEPGGGGLANLFAGSAAAVPGWHSDDYPMVSGFSPYEGIAGFLKWVRDLMHLVADYTHDNELAKRATDISDKAYKASEVYQSVYVDNRQTWHDGDARQASIFREYKKGVFARIDALGKANDEGIDAAGQAHATLYSRTAVDGVLPPPAEPTDLDKYEFEIRIDSDPSAMTLRIVHPPPTGVPLAMVRDRINEEPGVEAEIIDGVLRIRSKKKGPGSYIKIDGAFAHILGLANAESSVDAVGAFRGGWFEFMKVFSASDRDIQHLFRPVVQSTDSPVHRPGEWVVHHHTHGRGDRYR